MEFTTTNTTADTLRPDQLLQDPADRSLHRVVGVAHRRGGWVKIHCPERTFFYKGTTQVQVATLVEA